MSAPLVQLEVSADGVTWQHADTIAGYDAAASELAAIAGYGPGAWSDDLADGTTVTVTSGRTGREFRARVVTS